MSFENLKIRKAGITSVRRWNAVIDALNSLRILHFINGRVTWSQAGTVLAGVDPGSGSGGLGRLQPLQLVSATDDSGKKVRVVGSTLAGELPDGMVEGDDPPFILTGISGTGFVYGKITFSESTGEVTGREIVKLSDEPADEDGVIWVQVGSWSVDEDEVLHLSNARYGPINATICRDWYTSPPKYSASVA